MESTLTFPKYRSLTDRIEMLRSYPIVLLTFTVCAAAIQVDRIKWLPKYLKADMRQFLQNYGVSEMLTPTRKFFEWEGILSPPYVQGENTCAPTYNYLSNKILGNDSWLPMLDPFENKSFLASKIEILQSLIFMSGESDSIYGNLPIPNSVIYRHDANSLIADFVVANEAALQEMLGTSISTAIGNLASKASEYRGITNSFGCHSRISHPDIEELIRKSRTS